MQQHKQIPKILGNRKAVRQKEFKLYYSNYIKSKYKQPNLF